MSEFKMVKVPRKDGWMYASTSSTNGDDHYAKVWYNRDGGIDDNLTYSEAYKRQMGIGGSKGKKVKSSKIVDGKKKEGCITKILKAPFRLLWWVVKQVLIIVTFGYLSGVFDDDK